MSEEIRIDGITIAHNVIETVVNLATESVDEVASVGTSTMAGLAQLALRKNPDPAVEASEDGKTLLLRIHVHVYYGHKLSDVAEKIRAEVSQAVEAQIGIKASQIDVYIDGIVFQQG